MNSDIENGWPPLVRMVFALLLTLRVPWSTPALTPRSLEVLVSSIATPLTTPREAEDVRERAAPLPVFTQHVHLMDSPRF